MSDVVYIDEQLHNGELKRCQLQSGDVLLAITGATFGKACVVPDDIGPANINQHLVRMRPKSDLNPNYLALFINSELGTKQSIALATGGTRPALDYEAIRSSLIPLPPRPIQDRIAALMQDAYTQWWEKLAAAEALLGGIEGYVFDTLNINPASVKENNRFLKPLSDIKADRNRFDVAFNMGFHKFAPYTDGIKLVEKVATFPKETRNPETDPETCFEYIDIASIDITTGEISETQTILGANAPSRARQVVRTNDVIVSTVRPTRGASALIPEGMDNFICSTGFTIVRPKEDVIAEYLHIVLRLSTTLEQFGRRSAGTSYPAILESDIRVTLIPVPDKQTQTQIAKEVTRRRAQAAQLRQEAETIVTEAKARVERMILGEETP